MDSNEAFPETTPPTVKPAGIYAALAKFHEQTPAIGKDRTGQIGHQRYQYAPLDAILREVEPHLTKAGIVVFWESTADAVTCSAVCIADGSAVRSVWSYLTDATDSRGNIHQRHGIARTYARRYTLLDVLGICPTNDDTDAVVPDAGGSAGGNGDRPAARARTSSSSPVAAAPEGSVGAGLTDPQALAKGFADVLALSRRVKEAAKAAGDEATCRNDLMAVFVGTDKANPRYVWEGNPTTSFRRGDGKDVTIADVTRLVAEFTKIGKKYGVSS